ncbi:hypothetical protein N7492_006521 [Penicillium capsulatum]|uniref:Uncharacterized protein n=1 Tax=Penicillium capsulatum TaxID=69766 RepID=A0A9W9HY45_9EURO|nr:hypothetical protein N7492_006521 [Penicillium capsulatum]
MGERKASSQKQPKEAISRSRTKDAEQIHQTQARPKIPVNLYGFIDLLSDFYREIQSSQQDLPDEAIQLISRTLSFARSRLQGDDDQGAIQSHLVALTNLSQVIESAHPVALFGIATFAMFEVCCGSFGAWHCHLHGARSLLDLHCSNKTDLDGLVDRIPGLADVLAYLVWFDVTGALIQGRGLIFEDWHRGVLCPTFFESVGCPSGAFDLYSRLAEQNTQRDVLEFSSLAMVQVINIHLAGESTDRSLAAVVYRCGGAIVAFGRAGHGNIEPTPAVYSDVIASMVDRVCDALLRIPVTSRFYVHLATPVYLAGMYVTTESQRDTLRSYWRNCQQCEFPRYPDALEQCERRWGRVISGVDQGI